MRQSTSNMRYMAIPNYLDQKHPETVDASNRLKRSKGGGKDTGDVDGNTDQDDWTPG